VLHAAGPTPDIATHAAFVVTTVSRVFSIPDSARYLHGGYLTVMFKRFNIGELRLRGRSRPPPDGPYTEVTYSPRLKAGAAQATLGPAAHVGA
jgi:hypothetical protein